MVCICVYSNGDFNGVCVRECVFLGYVCVCLCVFHWCVCAPVYLLGVQASGVVCVCVCVCVCVLMCVCVCSNNAILRVFSECVYVCILMVILMVCVFESVCF